jgi:hypothetical protein
MGIAHFVQASSQSLCLVAFAANHLFYGSVLSLVFVLLGFGYVVLSRRPRPVSKFWTAMMIYSAVVICLKFVMQVPGVCMCHGESLHYWWFDSSLVQQRTSTTCTMDECNVDSGKAASFFSPPYLLGIVPRERLFASLSFWDWVVFLAVLFHVY